MNHPTFAVVGHPNKGKSSIVSALALDDGVAISSIPGTTHYNRSYPLRVDGKIIYELFDTPGFQRARKVLAWLEQYEVRADQKDTIVAKFIAEHKDDPTFHDEIELLEPILAGAGIIYVVDASKPYSSEYEAEMEILRWCNQPSMALINHIEEQDYSHEWKKALGHYFKLIRTYNPIKATYQDHITILESMAHLNEEWMQSIKNSIDIFKQHHQQLRHQAALIIATLLQDAIQATLKLPLYNEALLQERKAQLTTRYEEHLRTLEHKAYLNIQHTLHHQNLQTSAFDLPFEHIDLFSNEAASLFGLTKKELLLTATTSGALTGGAIDLAFAGHTGFLGALTGALIGSSGAYIGFEKLSEVTILGKKLGQKELLIGPMKNRNFPYILLGRAIFYTHLLLHHSHAKRQQLKIEMDESFKEQIFSATTRNQLEVYHKKFRAKKHSTQAIREEYAAIIVTILQQLDKQEQN